MIIASIIYYMQELNIWIAQVSDFLKNTYFSLSLCFYPFLNFWLLILSCPNCMWILATIWLVTISFQE